MLSQYSIFMMLLIVTASLVVIGSSVYKPANVETQPQQQQPQPQPQQQRLKVITTNVQPQSIVCIMYPLDTDLACNQNFENNTKKLTFNKLPIPKNQRYAYTGSDMYWHPNEWTPGR